MYPILKYPEIKGRNKYVKVRPWLRRPPSEVVIQSSRSHDPEERSCDPEDRSHDLEEGSHDPEEGSHDQEGGGATREIHLDQVNEEFERLVAMRGRMSTVGGAGLSRGKVGGVSRSKSTEK